MKVRLDRTVCDGFGTCAAHAPGYFSLDDWGYASLTNPADAARADAPPAEVPSAEVPSAEVPPANVPPANVPPANVPPANVPPGNVTFRNVAPGNVAPEDEHAVHRAILDCPVHAITVLRE
jgi:ferredoxin